MFYYDPLNESCKSVTGAVTENSPVKIRLKCSYDRCTLVLKKDGENEDRIAMAGSYGVFESELVLSVGLYFYYFEAGGKVFCRGEDSTAKPSHGKAIPFQLSVYSADFAVPEWISGGIIYQIFPDRFNRAEKNKKIGKGKVLHENLTDDPVFLPDENGRVLNNDFFGGDLKGIIEKLPYLKDLSVTAIYLNPIFEAYSNHRYDTGDYFSIDPLLGSIEDFEALIQAAEEFGIKIILDGVFSHTGDDSVYFDRYGNYGVGAFGNPDSFYRKWYKIGEDGSYGCWWGIDTLPELNKENADYADFIAGENGVLAYYTKKGIGGWRLDVADELPRAFIEKIRKRVKKINSEAIIIGEVWEDASNKISYGVRRKYFLGKELDSVMNYPLKNAVLDFAVSGNSENLALTVKEQIDHYPPFVLHSLMNVLSTHDTARLLSAVSGENAAGKSKAELAKIEVSGKDRKTAVERLKTAVLLQYTLCGVPSVYYGDEIGMQGFFDPMNRKFFAWDNADGDILSFYKKLGEIRSGYEVFEKGGCEILYSSGGAFVFKRGDKDSAALIAVNAGSSPKRISFEGTLENLLDGKSYRGEFLLEKFGRAVFVKE